MLFLCMCVDNDDYRCQHWNTWPKSFTQEYIDYEFWMITKMSSMCLQSTPNFQGCLNTPSNVDNIFKPTRKDNKHYDLQHKRTSTNFLSWFTQLKISITKASLFWNSFTWRHIYHTCHRCYIIIKNDFEKKRKKKGKQVELIIISFVHFFRELNSQLVSAKWLSLSQDYHYRLKRKIW
jgi:hypothetical protein